MNDRYTTTRMPYARANGAPPVMAGSYTCPELGRTCTRPGAYDAMALPSLQNGRQKFPAGLCAADNTEPPALTNAA
ncbi:hypothetical protein J2W32_000355 [Variovorax boronicumulans]|uniref:Uncharacterized protein n=1 Tax=Variovorax boronicumulans TaxID=436515 RepID=A0AAW8CU37_9BURK|nr:hypothetical protein [Variovorax boronicumulans]MDP9891258.1 hypothetical protein [Variovorax boronicumulans]MDQ0051326.1 hypothetical protein [Variovorax boronicumulans]